MVANERVVYDAAKLRVAAAELPEQFGQAGRDGNCHARRSGDDQRRLDGGQTLEEHQYAGVGNGCDRFGMFLMVGWDCRGGLLGHVGVGVGARAARAITLSCMRSRSNLGSAPWFSREPPRVAGVRVNSICECWQPIHTAAILF